MSTTASFLPHRNQSARPVFCSAFTEFLMGVSLKLGREDISNMKLITRSEKLLHVDVVDSLELGSDLLRALCDARVIVERDVRRLGNMLRCAGRYDLAAHADRYQSNIAPALSGIQSQTDSGVMDATGPCTPGKTKDNGICAATSGMASAQEAQELPMSEDDPDSQSSSQQSTVSMTDEEKLEQKHMATGSHEYDSQDLFDI